MITTSITANIHHIHIQHQSRHQSLREEEGVLRVAGQGVAAIMVIIRRLVARVTHITRATLKPLSRTGGIVVRVRQVSGHTAGERPRMPPSAAEDTPITPVMRKPSRHIRGISVSVVNSQVGLGCELTTTLLLR